MITELIQASFVGFFPLSSSFTLLCSNHILLEFCVYFTRNSNAFFVSDERRWCCGSSTVDNKIQINRHTHAYQKKIDEAYAPVWVRQSEKYSNKLFVTCLFRMKWANSEQNDSRVPSTVFFLLLLFHPSPSFIQSTIWISKRVYERCASNP